MGNGDEPIDLANAANRGFEPGREAADWSLAELQTDAIDAGRRL
jgi:hypothetical protein